MSVAVGLRAEAKNRNGVRKRSTSLDQPRSTGLCAVDVNIASCSSSTIGAESRVEEVIAETVYGKDEGYVSLPEAHLDQEAR